MKTNFLLGRYVLTALVSVFVCTQASALSCKDIVSRKSSDTASSDLRNGNGPISWDTSTDQLFRDALRIRDEVVEIQKNPRRLDYLEIIEAKIEELNRKTVALGLKRLHNAGFEFEIRVSEPQPGWPKGIPTLIITKWPSGWRASADVERALAEGTQIYFGFDPRILTGLLDRTKNTI